MSKRAEELKEIHHLEGHPEGGWFSEVYTSAFEKDGRPLAGSIYFLLDKDEISHFHQIDCEEIWYFHEGGGMEITVLTDARVEKLLLGNDVGRGERPMAVIPRGAVFAAENLDKEGFTFVSCATAPKFTYSGFRLVGAEEVRRGWPEMTGDWERLAWSGAENT